MAWFMFPPQSLSGDKTHVHKLCGALKELSRAGERTLIFFLHPYLISPTMLLFLSLQSMASVWLHLQITWSGLVPM